MQQQPTAPPPDVAPRDVGATFIEILVSIVILGTAGIAVLTALGAAATGAATHRSVSDAQASLATAGDAITVTDPDNSTYAYAACAAASDPAYGAVIAAAAPDVVLERIEYWTGTHWTSNVAACAYGAGERLQRLTLTTSVDGGARSLTVVKRPALAPTVDLGPTPPVIGGGTGNVVPTPTPGL